MSEGREGRGRCAPLGLLRGVEGLGWRESLPVPSPSHLGRGFVKKSVLQEEAGRCAPEPELPASSPPH